MRIMALDVGEKTIGVAVSDPTGLIAQGIQIINRKSIQKDFSIIKDLVEQYEVHEIIIGLPLNMNGTEGTQTEKTRRFGQKLLSNLEIPVIYWDERLTTMAAERMLVEEADLSRAKRKKVIDKMAAVYILQNYLDKERRTN